MHELGLAQSVLRAALSTPGVTKENLRGLTVHVGTLSGASIGALQFCLGAVLEDAGLAGVEAHVEEVPAQVRCECGHEHVVRNLFDGCPDCGGFAREILGGDDVTLESIEVEDGEDQA